jgi:hypothetical protein
MATLEQRRGKSTHVVTTAGHTDAQWMGSASLPLFTFFKHITRIAPLSMHHRPMFDFETNTSLSKGKNLKHLRSFLFVLFASAVLEPSFSYESSG